MAEYQDFERLENQMYAYRPELKNDSEVLKTERRKRLNLQLRTSYPLVQLQPLNALSSLVNIKNLLEKCKGSVLNLQDYAMDMQIASPSTSLLESSSDEFQLARRPRKNIRKRKCGSPLFPIGDISGSKNEHKGQEPPLSVSILIPQVVKRSNKMEISIDLGGIDNSQRLFGSRIDGLLRNNSNSVSSSENLSLIESPGAPNKSKNLQMSSTSGNIMNLECNNKKQDEMLSRLISEVLVENDDTETLQATNILDNINNNESGNYDAVVPVLTDIQKVIKNKKTQRKSKKKVHVEKPLPKKRGRKPKNKINDRIDFSENILLPKSDLAKYVELFSNSCNVAGSATPATSIMSQQLVSSTTHYMDSSAQQPITYYFEEGWGNGGSCQIIQTESATIDGGQEEFNMAELVNYIDNIGDAGNVIARVLDGSNTVPGLVQDSGSQNNFITPPPAHVSDILLDLSKKSSITATTTSTDVNNTSNEAVDDILPLDLSKKTTHLSETTVCHNSIITPSARLEAASEELFNDNDYNSFGVALDMPLIDIEDNINAFMELTNNQVITSANTIANLHTVGVRDFDLTKILAENTVCNADFNPETQVGNESQKISNDNNLNVTINSPKGSFDVPEIVKPVNSVKTNECSTDLVMYKKVENPASTISIACEAVSNIKGKDLEETNIINSVEKDIPCRDREKEEAYEFELRPTACTYEHLKVGEHTEANEDNCEVQMAIEKSVIPKNVDSCKIIDQSSSQVSVTTHIVGNGYCNNAMLNNYSTEDYSSNERHSKLIDFEGSMDNNEELHGNLSEKSSIDFLFVDTESVTVNISKCGFNGLSPSEIVNDKNNCVGGEKNNIALAVCDFSTKNSLSKGIDLEEECQDHKVSVHLPMPKLALMENSSEEFCYDDDIDFESSEEKDLLNADEENKNIEEKRHSELDDNNYLKKNETSENCCISKDGSIQSGILSMPQLTKTYGAEDFQEWDCLDQNENLNKNNKLTLNIQTGKRFRELETKMLDKANEEATIKQENTLSTLSVLEMESKLDDVCLDFEDELEDDALSLATSYFNSSDDERATSEKSYSNVIVMKETLNTDKSVLETASVLKKIQIPNHRESNSSTDNIFKNFKIPKISMTTATVKNNFSAGSMATAAPLPMVILPPNAFQKQEIKTEPDINKPMGFEKITRTVQNVCAVTPLTLQNSGNIGTSTSTTPSTLDVVAPLFRDILQLAPPIVTDDVKDFELINTGLSATLNSQKLNCSRGEFAGNGGDGRNFGPPTIVVAKTFGITCLPFLVGRCFTLISCKFSHTFRDVEVVKNILSTLSDVDLNITYKFAYNHELVFRRYMRVFCRVYFERNNRLKLLNMVRDCERYKDGGELITPIFHCLINCGLNKVNACRQILRHSHDKSRTTIDTLLGIILEADWTMFCDYIEKFSDISSYHFRLHILHQMAPKILRANDQRMTSVFFKCLVNLDPKDVGLVQSSPILMQLLELIKNGQACR